MSEKRFICGLGFPINSDDPIRIRSDSVEDKDYYKFSDICNILNDQYSTINALKEEKEYWEGKAMTLLMQVRRLTSRMTDKEVEEFSKELEDG